MSIIDLPNELILHIASFITREYLNEDIIADIEDELNIEFENLKQLLEYNGSDGCYYPLRNLYATCTSFKWLEELEYVCIEEGE